MTGPTTPELIATQIREYVADRPRVADTVLGIRDWWLPVESRGLLAADVQAAVDLLVEEGVLERVENSSGTTVYRARGS